MGSRKKAVNAFFAVCDDAMLDRWIPDEDWVRQIRDNGDSDCSISNLNMGMSRQCLWQNDRATLEGMSIFYNKKNNARNPPPHKPRNPRHPLWQELCCDRVPTRDIAAITRTKSFEDVKILVIEAWKAAFPCLRIRRFRVRIPGRTPYNVGIARCVVADNRMVAPNC
jgi:hypothetical protein